MAVSASKQSVRNRLHFHLIPFIASIHALRFKRSQHKQTNHANFQWHAVDVGQGAKSIVICTRPFKWCTADSETKLLSRYLFFFSPKISMESLLLFFKSVLFNTSSKSFFFVWWSKKMAINFAKKNYEQSIWICPVTSTQTRHRNRKRKKTAWNWIEWHRPLYIWKSMWT